MSMLMIQVLRQCQVEEQRLSHSIRHNRQMLHSLNHHVNNGSEAELLNNLNGEDISVKERQEIELLEQVLIKASNVRCNSEAPDKLSHSSCSKDPINNTVQTMSKKKSLSIGRETCLQVRFSKKDAKHNVVSTRLTFIQPPVNGRKLSIRPSLINDGQCQQKPHQTPGHSAKGQRTSLDLICERRIRSSKLELKTLALNKQWVPLPVLQAKEFGKNRLWNEILISHYKPGLERDQFKKRLTSTFPANWSSGHAAVNDELDVLIHVGFDLIHCFSAELQHLDLSSNPEMSVKNTYESLLMLSSMEQMMLKIVEHAELLKKVWKTKLDWQPKDLCPVRSRCERCDFETTSLIQTAFSSGDQLQELYTLRLLLDQIQLDIYLQQAMSDQIIHLRTCKSLVEVSDAVVLRSVYSLLGEGGVHFPSLVVDTEQIQKNCA